jgi:aspartyl-tRNA(Asn)/glutamyl-tRNA(Gln) amidotransferase subunit C
MFKKEDVEKLADLARIKLSEGEVSELQKELDTILSYVSEIQGVSVPDKEDFLDDHRNILREDKEPHESGVFTEVLLSQAPNREGDYIKVKKILSYD